MIDQTDTLPDAEADREMARLGIIRMPVDYFHVGQFRYTSLVDAVAQARRQSGEASKA